jgi:hypothetical protein
MKKYLLVVIGILIVTITIAYAQTRLDELIKATTYNGKKFIQSYRIENGSAYLQLNPSLWNSLSEPQKRQLCDALAASWNGMGLLNGWLYGYMCMEQR